MSPKPVTLSEILGEAGTLLRHHGLFLVGMLAASVAVYMGSDWLAARSGKAGVESLLYLLSGLFVTVFIQFMTIERLLSDRNLGGETPRVRRFGALFGALLLSGLAIIIGLFLFLIPGIYLAGRWLTAPARVVESKLGVMEALDASWRDSEPSDLVFSLTFALVSAPFIVFLAVAAWNDFEFVMMSTTVGALVLINTVSAMASVAGWVIGVAAFRRAVPTGLRETEVFS